MPECGLREDRENRNKEGGVCPRSRSEFGQNGVQRLYCISSLACNTEALCGPKDAHEPYLSNEYTYQWGAERVYGYLRPMSEYYFWHKSEVGLDYPYFLLSRSFWTHILVISEITQTHIQTLDRLFFWDGRFGQIIRNFFEKKIFFKWTDWPLTFFHRSFWIWFFR